jgi:hypothetical protein
MIEGIEKKLALLLPQSISLRLHNAIKAGQMDDRPLCLRSRQQRQLARRFQPREQPLSLR